MREQEQRKVSFQGTIKSVQPRSNVWRYRLDNRTHSMTGYNIFLTGIADGEERDFAIAISEKQQEKYKFHIGDEIKGTGWTRWVSQEQFRIRIVAALMMKVGWMISVHKIEMMKNRRRFQCHLR